MSSAEPSPPPPPSPQELKAALKAFKKRLKLTCAGRPIADRGGPDEQRPPVGDRRHHAARPVSAGRLGGIGPAGETEAIGQRPVRVAPVVAECSSGPASATERVLLDIGATERGAGPAPKIPAPLVLGDTGHACRKRLSQVGGVYLPSALTRSAVRLHLLLQLLLLLGRQRAMSFSRASLRRAWPSFRLAPSWPSGRP